MLLKVIIGSLHDGNIVRLLARWRCRWGVGRCRFALGQAAFRKLPDRFHDVLLDNSSFLIYICFHEDNNSILGTNWVAVPLCW